ncbi:MAG: flagellar biosynthesis protein FlgN [Rhodobacteraceae bacterium]|nr:MAG: flagellar biosynthesis protein FlgN [Paracoccaceae bacterium]
MTDLNPQALIDDLDSILDQERQALVQGDLNKLGELLTKKESLINDLNSITDLERESLVQLQDKVSRNQVLLDSAMEGIRAVAARMAELRRVRKGLDVYDQAGRRTRFSTRGSVNLEKRA